MLVNNGITSSPVHIGKPVLQLPMSISSSRQRDQFTDNGNPYCVGPDDQEEVPFSILLIYEGERVQHVAWSDMAVAQLTQDAAQIFSLPPPITSIILMLFGMHPRTLQLGGKLSDPPRVMDGSTILVFRVGAPVTGFQPRHGMSHCDGDGHSTSSVAHLLVPPLPQNPKFLGNFKLNKFDGNTRQ
jgi:hypothetical protein